MAGVFFVERTEEERANDAATNAAVMDAREAEDLAVVRVVLMEILPDYPEVLQVVRDEVLKRSGSGSGDP